MVRGSVPGARGSLVEVRERCLRLHGNDSGPSARGCSAKKIKLDRQRLQARFNGPLVHQSVRAEQAARRRGTAATKTRGLVSGGGAKPWRQKGTGRARAGSSRSPIWTGGGIAFGPHPRYYTFKVNRKEQRAALRTALSLHAQRGSIAVLDTAAFAAPKTSQAPTCWTIGARPPRTPRCSRRSWCWPARSATRRCRSATSRASRFSPTRTSVSPTWWARPRC